MELNELIEEFLDEDGNLPPEKLPEATEKMVTRLKLSGKQVEPAVLYQVEKEHQHYVTQSLWFQIIELNSEMLALLDAVQQLTGTEAAPVSYDPEEDFAGMMAALEFDKVRRIYQKVLA